MGLASFFIFLFGSRELSGGERRRTRIFRGNAVFESGTQFILFDEPFNGMSPMLVDQIKQKISENCLH
jgi:ABC-type lipopolysaccharide export system ATPase subunit